MQTPYSDRPPLLPHPPGVTASSPQREAANRMPAILGPRGAAKRLPAILKMRGTAKSHAGYSQTKSTAKRLQDILGLRGNAKRAPIRWAVLDLATAVQLDLNFLWRATYGEEGQTQ